MIDYSQARFRMSEVARACDIAPHTLRSYFQRKQFRIVGMKAQLAEANGQGHLFTLYDVMGLAVAVQLMRAGVRPEKAFDTAMLEFAHTGDERRDPARTFNVHEHGETFMILGPGSDRVEIVAADEITGLDALMPPLLSAGYRPIVIVIRLNDIENRVLASLEISRDELPVQISGAACHYVEDEPTGYQADRPRKPIVRGQVVRRGNVDA